MTTFTVMTEANKNMYLREVWASAETEHDGAKIEVELTRGVGGHTLILEVTIDGDSHQEVLTTSDLVSAWTDAVIERVEADDGSEDG